MIERKRFHVRCITAHDCINNLPMLEPYSGAGESLDFFITAAGFEERVLAIPQKLLSDGTAVRNATLVGNYRTNVSENEARYKDLHPILNALGAPIALFEADDPIGIVSAISNALEGGKLTSRGEKSFAWRVGFDISGASSTLVLSVIAALARFSGLVSLTVFYATARSYDQPLARTGDPESEDRREAGVSTEPLNAPFVGFHHDHLPVSVIALPSLYTKRLETCLAHLNVGPITGSSDNLYWLLPATGAEEHKWRQEHTRRAVNELLLRLQGLESRDSDVEVIKPDDMTTCDVLNYSDTIRRLVERIDNQPGRNISIVHMGSKVQGIGVALAASARSEVAVLTVRPASFNAEKYSCGIGERFVLRFPDLGRVIKSIADIGSLVVEPL